ncbi:D-glutamate cyclase family protein [Paenarthrobacter sp. NPDC091711]|uniref:D-glutamate cyclase family protein n=1 Tax=Paenarthrobacter sp. NPDC091711 TaxID=3364385 RepID=UPI00382C3C99
MTNSSETVHTAARLRELISAGHWNKTTAGLLPGKQQANLVIVPKDKAFEFLLYCVRNPQACPIIAVTEPGNPIVTLGTTVADVRVALPRYRVWEHGELTAEPEDVINYWRPDSVGFLLGCSHTWEGPLERAGVDFGRSPQSPAPAAYVSNLPTNPVGEMGGPLVVSVRLIPERQVSRTFEITARYPKGHGAPVHVGDPSAIGVQLLSPDFGPVPEPRPGDVPVFWACGVTPQLFLPHIGADAVISHYPGHMFVFDHDVDENPQQV